MAWTRCPRPTAAASRSSRPCRTSPPPSRAAAFWSPAAPTPTSARTGACPASPRRCWRPFTPSPDRALRRPLVRPRRRGARLARRRRPGAGRAAQARPSRAATGCSALAERPLLLTLMACLHAWRGGSLPEKREAAVRRRGRPAAGPVGKRQGGARRQRADRWCSSPAWPSGCKVDRDAVRGLLDELAFEAHADQPDWWARPTSPRSSWSAA